MQRRNHASGTEWESAVGYSRSVRVGPFVYVSGTTATGEDGSIVAPDDPYRQTRKALENVTAALAGVGADRSDVVRTRLYVTDVDRWEAIGRTHEEAFGEVAPTTSMVEVGRLVDPEMCVEIEADAVVADADGDSEP